MHATCSTHSDLCSINISAGHAKATRAARDPLGALSGNGNPCQQPGTTGTGLVSSYHGQWAEAGR
jgi:hypothetical protein